MITRCQILSFNERADVLKAHFVKVAMETSVSRKTHSGLSNCQTLWVELSRAPRAGRYDLGSHPA